MKNKITLVIAFAVSITSAWAQCSPCNIPFVNSSAATGTSADVTMSVPPGVQPGDVMIAAIHIGWCNSGPVITPPAGWTLINNTSNTGPGCGASNTTIQLATFYKVVTNAEPLNYTFTGNASNQEYVGAIVAYTNVNAAAPIDASSTFGTQEMCSNIVADSVITTSPCRRLVAAFFCSVNSSATNIVPQSSLTERADVSTTGNHPWGNENLSVADELFTTSGNTGNRTAYLTGCSGNSWVTGAQLIALACNTSTAADENFLNSAITVTPDASGESFQIRVDKENFTDARAEVYNLSGEKIFSSPISGSTFRINVASQPGGIYFVEVKTSRQVFRTKIIKR